MGCLRVSNRINTRLPQITFRYDGDARGSRAPLQWVAVVIATASRVKVRLYEGVSRGIFVVAVAGIMFLLSGCDDNGVVERFMLKPDRIIVERWPDPAYDDLFPYYVELCATSQFRSKLKGNGGSPATRSCTSKGAFKDDQAPFPQHGDAGSSRQSPIIRNTVRV